MKYNAEDLLGNVFPNLRDGEYITIFKTNNEYNITKHFRSIEEALEWANKGKEYYNTYFNLSTTDGSGRKAENQLTRHCLVIDLDSKDFKEGLTLNDIINKFKAIRLYYHAVVSTGNGFHIYIFIEPTKELELVADVTKAIAQRVGGDMKATLTTQIMRLPNTFNIKTEDKKQVKLVHIADNIILKDINYYDRNYNTVSIKKELKYLNRSRIAPCIKELLEGYIPQGSRNEALLKLVPALRNEGRTLAEIRFMLRSKFSGMKDYNYQVEYIFKNKRISSLECCQCAHKGECYSCYIDYTEGKYIKDEEMIIHESIVKKFMTRNKGNNTQLGNSILFYALLEHFGELDKAQLESITLFSARNISNILKRLEEQGFIKTTTKGRKKYYSAITPTIKYDYTFTINIGILTAITNNEVTPSMLGVYFYMKLVNSERQRYFDKAIKGNILQLNQEDIARALNIKSASDISKVINKLIDNQILSLYDRKKKANSMFMYNIYLLNY